MWSSKSIVSQYVVFFALTCISHSFTKGENFLLNNMTDGRRQIQLQQQSTSVGCPAEEMSTHQLLFQMNQGICPAEGLLVCYPSRFSIDANSKAKARFRYEAEENEATQKCEEKRRLAVAGGEKTADGQKWHGIWARKQKFEEDLVELQFSIGKKKIKLSSIKEFLITLGSPSGPLPPTRIRPRLEAELSANPSELPLLNAQAESSNKAFGEEMKNGAFFGDYAELWALGFDMLSNAGTAVDLHIFWDCKCLMKVWFITDPGKLPEWNFDEGKKQCPADNGTTQAEKKKNLYLLNSPVNETKAITMNFKFNADAEKPVINLLHFWNKEDWKKYYETIIVELANNQMGGNSAGSVHKLQEFKSGHLLNISFSIDKSESRIKGMQIQMIGVDAVTIPMDEPIRPEGHALTLNQFMLETGIVLDGKSLANITPHEYFHFATPVRINAFKVEGMDVLELSQPFAHNLTDREVLTGPHVHRLSQELRGGENIHFWAKIPENSTQIDIQFLYNADEMFRVQGGDEPDFIAIGEWILHLKATFNSPTNRENDEQNKPDSIYIRTPRRRRGDPWTQPGDFKNRWYQPELKSVEINSAGLKPGDLFTLSIQVPQPDAQKRNEETDMESYEFTLKYHLGQKSSIIEVQKNVFPVWMIQRIRFEGINLIGAPTITSAPPEEAGSLTNYSISIPHLKYSNETRGGLLLAGDQIIFKGRVPENAQTFSISFCHEQTDCKFEDEKQSNYFGQIGSNVLIIEVHFPDVLFLHACTREVVTTLPIIKTLSTIDKNCQWEKTRASDNLKNPLTPGHNFTIEVHINAKGDMFNVKVADAENTLKLEANYVLDFIDEDKVHLPPWSADHIQIKGDVLINRSEISRNHREWPLQLPYAVHFPSQLVVGSRLLVVFKLPRPPRPITITTTATTSSSSITTTATSATTTTTTSTTTTPKPAIEELVNHLEPSNFQLGLYNNRLELGDCEEENTRPSCQFGATLMRIDFENDLEENVEGVKKIYAFYRKKVGIYLPEVEPEDLPDEMKWPPVEDGEIALEIEAKDKHLAIRFLDSAGVELSAANFTYQLPLWAAEYLYVQGKNLKLKDVKIEI